MKIRSIKAWREKLPLKKSYTIAYKTIVDTDLIFAEITLENGITGIGSSNPFPEVVGETSDITVSNLNSGFVENFNGRDIRAFQQLIDETATNFPNRPGTLAAIDIALHDAFGKYLGISVLDFYGKKIEPLPTSITIGIKETNAMIEEAKGYQALGFRVLKIKTGHNVDEDIERVHKLKEAFKDAFIIRVDANQGYTIEQLQKFIKEAGEQVELIEQPVKAGTDDLLQQLEPNKRKVLAADESLLDETNASFLSHPPQPYGIYNIKLMKCGGIKGARAIASLAKHAGINLFWGCNDESIISITAALHAAYSCSNTKYLDLDGSFDLSKDLVEGGFIVKDGYMYPTNEPGFGFTKI
jgi:L-alanine-DL-glutamate epimerase-like enolase superfamily enzyme